jgi:phosphopantothenoylcysteine decarboxylase/phosphopantothenate--cysteine ligase
MDFSGKTIAIGITGGIAAYKACDLIRELYRRGAARVICVMTDAAQAFITPLTLQALSRQPVYTSALSVEPSGVPIHIVLAQQADALLILPATADMMAKLAHGFADDLVSTTAITFTDKPVLVAPAMNTRMWNHPLTHENVHTLRKRAGYVVIEPCAGHLACGETGDGHLADMETILQQLYKAVHPNAGLYQGMSAIVTAGGTNEPIDPVRVISNRSSGKMGLALADELFAMGADVTLITTRPPASRPYTMIPVQSALEMQETLQTRFAQTDLLLMAAAVADYSVANPSTCKIKREHQAEMALGLVRNPDILAELGPQKQPTQWVVGFAAESENLLQQAQEKMRRKHLDAIVANDISRSDIGFESDQNEVTLLFSDDRFPNTASVSLPRATKGEIARQILCLLHQTFRPSQASKERIAGG